MNYLIKFIKTFGPTTALIATLGLFGHVFDRGDRGETVAQNITIEYLERILGDLIADGVVPADATLCDVDWLQYGIVVSLNCKTRLRAAPGSKQNARLVPYKQDPTPTPEIVGVPTINCNLSGVEFRQICESIRADTYSRNLAAPWAVNAQDICNAVMDTLRVNTLSGSVTCLNGEHSSEIMLGGGISGGRSEAGRQDGPFAFISVQQGPSDPPVFSITLIGSPHVLDGMNGDNFFERVDFLLFWTFKENGEFDVKVETLLVLQGQIGSSIDAMRQVKLNERFGRITGSVRRSRVRPANIATRISENVQSVTELIRNSIEVES